MIFIYDSDEPVVLRSLVNSENGFMVLPKGEDDDSLLFENWDRFAAWVKSLAEVAAAGPADLQSYDDWCKEGPYRGDHYRIGAPHPAPGGGLICACSCGEEYAALVEEGDDEREVLEAALHKHIDAYRAREAKS